MAPPGGEGEKAGEPLEDTEAPGLGETERLPEPEREGSAEADAVALGLPVPEDVNAGVGVCRGDRVLSMLREG